MKFIGGETEREPKPNMATRNFVAEAIAKLVEKKNASDAVGKLREPAMIAYEVCDPVQDRHYDIRGIRVSDFVVPEWYEPMRVRGSKYTRAWAYDFGKIMSGQIRLTRTTMIGADVIDVRLTGTKEQLLPVEGDLHSFCFAPGERTVTDPETRLFRYVAVYERQ
jgi:hypothetical protein